MLVKTIIDTDLINYKIPGMLIGFPACTFKCDKECGKKVCQNSKLSLEPNIAITINNIINRYIKNNKYSHSLICGGLEPFDSWEDLLELIVKFREVSQDDVVIYTGYNKDEILNKVEILKSYPNIIIKFGRFVPNQEKHFDEVLGVELASTNQYAERIS